MNGETDCSDPACSAFECAETAPAGFDGFYRIAQSGYPNNGPAACPGGSAPKTYYEAPNPADCTLCSCDAPAGGSCGAPALTCWNNANNCTGFSSFDPMPKADGTCAPGNLKSFSSASCKITGASAVLGSPSCSPSGGGLKAPEPWKLQDDVCGAKLAGGGGCAGGKVCVPKGDATYGNVCVMHTGDQPCGAVYATKILAHSGGMDQRACSACGCVADGVTCAGGAYTPWSLNTCTGTPGAVFSDMGCHDVTNQAAFGTGSVQLTTLPTLGGMCSTTGGSPSGAVVPSDAVTFCCKP
jgi:hypothetical protein